MLEVLRWHPNLPVQGLQFFQLLLLKLVLVQLYLELPGLVNAGVINIQTDHNSFYLNSTLSILLFIL